MALKSPPLDPDEIAIRALGFLAADEERLTRFLSLTGLSPQTLRKAASEPGFLVSVLTYLSADERLLLAFSSENQLDPQRLTALFQRLQGSDGSAS